MSRKTWIIIAVVIAVALIIWFFFYEAAASFIGSLFGSAASTGMELAL